MKEKIYCDKCKFFKKNMICMHPSKVNVFGGRLACEVNENLDCKLKDEK